MKEDGFEAMRAELIRQAGAEPATRADLFRAHAMAALIGAGHAVLGTGAADELAARSDAIAVAMIKAAAEGPLGGGLL